MSNIWNVFLEVWYFDINNIDPKAYNAIHHFKNYCLVFPVVYFCSSSMHVAHILYGFVCKWTRQCVKYNRYAYAYTARQREEKNKKGCISFCTDWQLQTALLYKCIEYMNFTFMLHVSMQYIYTKKVASITRIIMFYVWAAADEPPLPNCHIYTNTCIYIFDHHVFSLRANCKS